MPARRCSTAELALTLALCVACQEEPSDAAPPRASAEPAPAAAPAPVVEHAVAALARARAAAARFARGRARADYLALRRGIAAAAPLLRIRAPLGTELLLGPARLADEGAGALGALDAALVSGDRPAADRQLDQVSRALRLVENEIVLHGVPDKQALQAMSDAAFDLGLLLLEASGSVPFEPDAVLADLRGTLEGITGAARAVAGQRAALGGLEERARLLAAAFAKAKHSHALTDRVELVRASGELGVAVRRLAKALGHASLALPYRARHPVADNGIDEPVTPLTLPAPRRDARAGDLAAIAEIGRKLFFDRRLSKGDARSCADCHRPDRAFSDGLVVPRSLDPASPITRNTPTLLYAPLHAAQLWDGRFASAERQAIRVIHTAAEMGVAEGELTAVVSADADYRSAFASAFEDGVSAANVARALVAYQVKDLVPGTAPIDRFARGGPLDARARAGLDVFSAAGRCARCHVPPSFAGSRPPDFAVPVLAAIGVPATPSSKELDADAGRERVSRRAIDRGVFKTPTVRNVALTAPYFHHGRFPTLESVVDFYDRGGGTGAGVSIDNQDPDVRPLKLTPAQRSDLLFFMRETLRDAP